MDEHGFHVDPANIQAIRDWLTPTTLTKLRSFLGLANFYHKFGLGFSNIAWHLIQVKKSGSKSKFISYNTQQHGFEDMKKILCSTPVLTLPHMQKPFEIDIDALEYIVGAFLTQHGHMVAYHIEKLLYIVYKYPTYDK